MGFDGVLGLRIGLTPCDLGWSSHDSDNPRLGMSQPFRLNEASEGLGRWSGAL